MSKNSKEPDWPPAFKRGYLSLPTAGMRLAPQVLTLELMREVAYAGSGGATNTSEPQTMPLDPALESSPLQGMPPAVLAGIHALRGRAKERKAQNAFYAPSYPRMAGFGWMRRSTDRVIRDFFIRGALACGTSGALGRDEVVESTVSALYGDGEGNRDVLALCAEVAPRRTEMESPDAAAAQLHSLVSTPPDWGLSGDDIISRRITRDWHALCRMEPFLPRLAWVELVGTFLRTVVPLWLLAQMRVCVITRDFVREALDSGATTAADVRKAIDLRHSALLVPSTTLTDRVDDAVIEYMRARIELKVVFLILSQEVPQAANDLRLPLSVEARPGTLGLSQIAGFLQRVPDLKQFARQVVRESEAFPAWSRPLKVGQGKNIEEFLRVMRDDHVGGQDDGFLLERGPANRRLFRVFPAARVLALYTLLAHAEKAMQNGPGQRLLLTDLERVLGEMGIDFTVLGGVRAELLKALSRAGILRGTPDAGEGAVLASPYSCALESFEESIAQ